jgi:hypothetical protein
MRLKNAIMKRYIIIYFAVIAETLLSFFVLLRSLNGDYELWRVVCALAGFVIILTLTVYFLVRLRRVNGR